MNKTKKSGFLKIAGLMAAVMMLTTCVVAGTMAKYTSSGTADLADVTPAHWNITANGNALTTPVSGLEWTIYKEGTEQKVEDSSVTSGKIAPGTWGYATIEIKNESEVAATLTVTGFTAPDENSTGLEFGCTYATDKQTTYANISGANAVSGLSNVALAKGASIYLYVYYQWAYDGDDTHDTALGTAAAELAFSSVLSIVADQAVPVAAAGD